MQERKRLLYEFGLFAPSAVLWGKGGENGVGIYNYAFRDGEMGGEIDELTAEKENARMWRFEVQLLYFTVYIHLSRFLPDLSVILNISVFNMFCYV